MTTKAGKQPTITQADILATEFDRIRLAFDSVNRDRDRLKAIITTLRVNAIKGQDPEALLAFVREGLGGVDAGLTIGEMVIAYDPEHLTRTTSLAAQEPVAMRYDFDGYGWKYIDSGSGSNWQTRHADAEPLYAAPSLAAQDGLAPLIVAGMNLRQYWEDVDAYKKMDATVMIMKSGEMRKRDAETKREFLDALQAALSAIKGDKS